MALQGTLATLAACLMAAMTLNRAEAYLVINPNEAVLGISDWGTWEKYQRCPSNKLVQGFQLKVQRMETEDQTVLNNIIFQCNDPHYTNLIAKVGIPVDPSAEWGVWQHCPGSSYIRSVFMRSMADKGEDRDNMAAMNLMVKCSDNQKTTLYGDGWASGGRVEVFHCPANHGVCSLQARIQAKQGKGDDTALNQIKITCCRYSP